MKIARQRLPAVAALLALMALVFGLAPVPARSASTTVLITAVFYDTYLDGEPDEAFRITNVGGTDVDLTDWTVTDLEGTITLTGTLLIDESLWCYGPNCLIGGWPN